MTCPTMTAPLPFISHIHARRFGDRLADLLQVYFHPPHPRETLPIYDKALFDAAHFHLPYPRETLLTMMPMVDGIEALHIAYPHKTLQKSFEQSATALSSPRIPTQDASAEFTKNAPLRLCNFAQIHELSSVFVANIVGLTRTFSTLGREIALCFGANLFSFHC